jgi:hypothetical protein
MTDNIPSQLLDDIRQIVTASRLTVAQTVNSAMVLTYWQVGRLIVEYEQQGQVRAGYGKKLLAQLPFHKKVAIIRSIWHYLKINPNI